MKKIILLTLLLALLLCGCKDKKTADAEDTSTQPTEHPHQQLKEETGKFDWDRDLLVDIPQIGLTDVRVQDHSSAAQLDGQTGGEVYLLADHRYGQGSHADHYLLIVMGQTLIAQDLRADEQLGAMEAAVTLADMDGDGDSEILLQEKMDGMGGAGQYRTRIFNYKDGKVTEMFSSIVEGKLMDTGFGVTLRGSKQFAIQNSIVGYREVFALNQRGDDYFEAWYEEGQLRQMELGVDSFFECKPVDIDGDGVCEIECVQYVWLTAHTDHIGWAHSVMKYDEIAGEFRVVDAWFEAIQ